MGDVMIDREAAFVRAVGPFGAGPECQPLIVGFRPGGKSVHCFVEQCLWGVRRLKSILTGAVCPPDEWGEMTASASRVSNCFMAIYSLLIATR